MAEKPMQGDGGGSAGRAGRFLFAPLDFLMDPVVLAMQLEARGAYITLLCNLWSAREPGMVQANDRVLALLAHCTPEQWERVKDELGRAFDTVQKPGWWVQRRMVRTHAAQQRWLTQRRAYGRKGAIARYAKQKAGVPKADPQPAHAGLGVGVGVGVGESEEHHRPAGAGHAGAGGQLVLDGSTAPKPAQLHSRERAEWVEAFEMDFWPQYPRKVAKPRAVRAWCAIRPWSQSRLDEVMAGLDRWVAWWQAQGTPRDKVPHPATWLNDQRWENEP